MSLVQDTIRSYLPNQKVGANGWISFNCPVCHHNGQDRADARRRGGIMFPDDATIRYSCFNCHFKTGWQLGSPISFKFKQFLLAMGMPESVLQRLIMIVLKENEAASIITPVIKVRQLYRPDWKPISLPENSQPLQDCLSDSRAVAVAEYLHSRNLLDQAAWHWSDSNDFDMYNRVILPLTYQNTVVGWHARLAYDPVIKPKRKIVKMHDSYFMSGLDLQSEDRKYVILVEGEYDALAISGVSIGGNSVHQNQADVINQLKKEVIVLPDRDRSGRELEKSALQYGWSVSYPEWDKDCKDAADAVKRYGRLFVLKNIIEHRESNKIKLTVMGKYYYNE